MISGLSPGDLFHTHCGEFIVFHSIELMEGHECSVMGQPYKRVNEMKYPEKMFGIIISQPELKEEGYVEGHMLYVLLPDMIGWTRNMNVMEVLT